MREQKRSIRFAAIGAITAGLAISAPIAYFLFFFPEGGTGSPPVGIDASRKVAIWWGILAPALTILTSATIFFKSNLDLHRPLAGSIASLAWILCLLTLILGNIVVLGATPFAITGIEIKESEPFDFIGLFIEWTGMLLDLSVEFFAFVIGIGWMIISLITYFRLLGRAGMGVLAIVLGIGFIAFVFGFEILSFLIFTALPSLYLIAMGMFLIFVPDVVDESEID